MMGASDWLISMSPPAMTALVYDWRTWMSPFACTIGAYDAVIVASPPAETNPTALPTASNSSACAEPIALRLACTDSPSSVPATWDASRGGSLADCGVRVGGLGVAGVDGVVECHGGASLRWSDMREADASGDAREAASLSSIPEPAG